jgi:hypothetical protein
MAAAAQTPLPGDAQKPLRRFLLAILVLGLAGTAAELLITNHTEDAWQWVPLALIGMALLAVAWHEAAPCAAASHWLLRAVLVLFLGSGVAGIALHWRGKVEFQLESDPSLSGWKLIRTAAESKTPPALAPGVMLQLGLVGLAYQAAGKARRQGGSL